MRGRASLIPLLCLAASVQVGCAAEKTDADEVYDYTDVYGADTDSKALIYNLIGRWFPEGEIDRLDDDSMTPEAWCARDPTHIRVHLDEVVVQCDSGEPYSAAIARVARHEPSGGIELVLRAAEDAALKTLVFEEVKGTQAKVAGSPCFEGEVAEHARFPKIEVLRRQILGGQRCTQVRDRAAAAAGGLGAEQP